MPRARQQGAVGKAYSNRTDLNKASTPRTVPGQEYGMQTAQMAGMAKAPVAQSGAPSMTPNSAAPSAPAQPPAMPPRPSAMPGQLGWMDPGHPNTNMADPGYQPPNFYSMRVNGVADLLDQIAQTPGAPKEVQKMAIVARGLANRSNSNA